MKLVDLDPHWLVFEDRRVGFAFRSPTNAKWWQTCFVEPFYTFKGRDGRYRHDDEGYSPDSQAGLVARAVPEAREWFQACNSDHQWQVAGGIDAASFETITVTPSLDGSAGGLWHGFITGGQIVGGL